MLFENAGLANKVVPPKGNDSDTKNAKGWISHRVGKVNMCSQSKLVYRN